MDPLRWRCVVLALVFCLGSTTGIRIQVISWNVADNDRMDGTLRGDLVAQLLKVDKSPSPADIYGISLQENCFLCDANRIEGVAELFQAELKKAYGEDFQLDGIDMTRDSDYCQWKACSLSGLHGTTMIFSLSKAGVVKSAKTVKVNKCSAPILFLRNSEKGIVGIKTVLESGKKICFAGGHLDSKKPESRRECVKEFFEEAEDEDKWSECDKIYLTGDFNARTAKNDHEEEKEGVTLTEEQLKTLIEKDEMSGSDPFGGKTLVSYVAEVSKKEFVEPQKPIVDVPGFVPTYSILQSKYCQGESPCYRKARSPAWTDRIVCANCGDVQFYSSLPEMSEYSDHLPVVGVYEDKEF